MNTTVFKDTKFYKFEMAVCISDRLVEEDAFKSVCDAFVKAYSKLYGELGEILSLDTAHVFEETTWEEFKRINDIDAEMEIEENGTVI